MKAVSALSARSACAFAAWKLTSATRPIQIECIHCGDCIDACVDVLGRLGKEGLIHYVWGERAKRSDERQGPGMQRLGLRDAKRVVVLLVVLCYAGGLYTALAMRRTVLVRIPPDRATMYRLGSDGTVYNRFRLQAANRGHQQATLILTQLKVCRARALIPLRMPWC